ncbi:Uncharacterised protein [Legionella sainthelensi]|nr:Uncharacterised protein [Legionella sainthelensi]
MITLIVRGERGLFYSSKKIRYSFHLKLTSLQLGGFYFIFTDVTRSGHSVQSTRTNLFFRGNCLAFITAPKRLFC